MYKTIGSILFLALLMGLLDRDATAARSKPTATIFVASNGNDAWSGSLAEPNAARTDGPLATVGAAQKKVRELRRSAACLAPLTVWIRGGRYRLTKPLQFGPEDSGPTTYAAYPGEQPVFERPPVCGAEHFARFRLVIGQQPNLDLRIGPKNGRPGFPW